MRRLVATFLALLLLPALVHAVGDVPVRVRVLKGSRVAPAQLDPKLEDVKKQLGKLSYTRWEQVADHRLTMTGKKTQFVDLPDGEHVALTLQEVRGDTVTFEVALAQHNTMSRLTIEKGQRIVHQVTREKGGVAYFVTVHAWP
ncbi:MAG TPA: hypothetical protein VFP50_19220 [Anaeromyxobacteraceae bacterium]|nr:hypothetical protein [Anaeromyxobacteraceae bacterium]